MSSQTRWEANCVVDGGHPNFLAKGCMSQDASAFAAIASHKAARTISADVERMQFIDEQPRVRLQGAQGTGNVTSLTNC